MWKALVVAMSVLVAGMFATEGQPEFRVKLCGREFIRAVIFTCGGSRWRRALMSTDDISYSPFSTHRDKSWDRRSLKFIPEVPSQQLQDMAASDWSSEGEGGLSFSRASRSATLEEVLEAFRSSERKGRDAVVGLSNACCKWGCSKNDISSLC
ncbi:hypothetical protein GJAV_G00265280 [Gymnothorax javanicus]|nr:hypothetical protein GJAV_G00265280 [Gymnothorax javanicus]